MTYSLEGCCARSFQFNSRTREGCDVHGETDLLRGRGFNSCTREGCDRLRLLMRETGGDVSIHAPARGATSLSSIPSGLFDKFQFTHPQGVRQHRKRNKTLLSLFQFTHPQGVRLAQVVDHRRRDVVSIHAPARGATRDHRAVCSALRVSIHAPARGATP